MSTEPIMDATSGWVSAPGMKRDVVLCAVERPAKARARVRESSDGDSFVWRRLSSQRVCGWKLVFQKLRGNDSEKRRMRVGDVSSKKGNGSERREEKSFRFPCFDFLGETQWLDKLNFQGVLSLELPRTGRA